MNLRADRRRLRRGEFSQLSGVDGRFVGGLRKLPGLSLIADLGAVITTEPIDSWYVTLQRGTADYLLRGFLILWDNGGTHTLTFRYYDESTSAWATYTLTGLTLTATSEITVAGPARFCYIAIDGQAPQVMYWDTAMTHEDMGPGTAFDSVGDTGTLAPVYNSGVGETAGGYLAEGIYNIAYRFRNSVRGIYSSISDTLEHTVVDSVGDGLVKLTITNPFTGDPDGAYDQGYDKLQIFRGISAEIGGDLYAAGMLRMETEYDLDSGADCWPATVEVGIMRDDDLMWQDVYDPRWDISGAPPQTGVIANVEGVNFMGSDSSTGSGQTQIQWSPTHRMNAETFPVGENTYKWDVRDGKLVALTQGGDHLYAFTDNAVFRVLKSGSQLAISKAHDGRSLVNRHCSESLGRDIFGVTDVGAVIFDGMRGTMNVLNNIDRRVVLDWRSDYADLRVVGDSMMGASIIVNRAEDAALVLWHVTGAATEIDDLPCSAVCSGPHPEQGGRTRGYFIDEYAKVWALDPGEDNYYSMRGLNPATVMVEGVVGSSTNTTLAALGGLGWTTDILEGAKVYVYPAADTEGAYQVRTISSAVIAPPDGVLTVSSAWTTNPSAGDRFVIAPVVFRVRGWPLTQVSSPPEFGRKNVYSMGAYAKLGTFASNAGAYWTYGVCRDLEQGRPTVRAVVPFSVVPAEQHAHIARDGTVVEPWLEQLGPGLELELMSMGLDAKITSSRKTI